MTTDGTLMLEPTSWSFGPHVIVHRDRTNDQDRCLIKVSLPECFDDYVKVIDTDLGEVHRACEWLHATAVEVWRHYDNLQAAVSHLTWPES